MTDLAGNTFVVDSVLDLCIPLEKRRSGNSTVVIVFTQYILSFSTIHYVLCRYIFFHNNILRMPNNYYVCLLPFLSSNNRFGDQKYSYSKKVMTRRGKCITMVNSARK